VEEIVILLVPALLKVEEAKAAPAELMVVHLLVTVVAVAVVAVAPTIHHQAMVIVAVQAAIQVMAEAAHLIVIKDLPGATEQVGVVAEVAVNMAHAQAVA
jgi:hypothetical protein